MRDPLTFQAWPWALIGAAILAGFLGVAHWYEDHYLPRIRRQLADAAARPRTASAPADPYITARMVEHTDVVLTPEGATLAYQLDSFLAQQNKEGAS